MTADRSYLRTVRATPADSRKAWRSNGGSGTAEETDFLFRGTGHILARHGDWRHVRASQPEPLKVRANDLRALACGMLERSPFQYANSSVLTRDQPGVLECAEDQRHGRTMHAEHDGEKVVLQQKLAGADAILCLQQPPATALLDPVQRIARRALHDLQEVGLRVQRQDVVKGSRRGALFDKATDSHRRERAIRHLLER